jgi:protoheme ferro-lyase
MDSRESTEEEMRQDGIEKPKGIYCKRCGYYWEDWDRFFQHHRGKHPWLDPNVLKTAIEAGHEYVKQWRKMIGIRGNNPWK